MADRQDTGLWPRRFYESGPLALDALKYRAYLGDADLALTEDQFDALCLLVQREGEAMTFEELYNAVWEPPDDSDRREEARQGLAGLAERCAAMGKGEIAVEAVPGQGYRFRRGTAQTPPL